MELSVTIEKLIQLQEQEIKSEHFNGSLMNPSNLRG